MMVVDASALVAILLEEPEGERFKQQILEREGSLLSPVGYWEAATRLRILKDKRGVADLDILLGQLSIEISAADGRTARLASEAERRFGKRTPANLNLGDCFAYALAVEQDAPLLFKGADFAATDVRRA